MPLPGAESPPRVFVQVDHDSLWAVRRVYGLPVSESHFERDPLYELAIPRFLELFAEYDVPATFFAIGRDAEVPLKRDLLRRIHAAGHEIGNHSWSHPIGLGSMAAAEVADEIGRAQDVLGDAIGAAPTGLRSPGYDAAPRVLEAAALAGLAYDSSILPTRVGPVLRGVSNLLKRRGARSPRGHYGRGPVWRAPRAPYRMDPAQPWDRGDGLVELPLSVSPVLGLPIHASVAMLGASGWVCRAVRSVARRHGVVVFAFHGLDLVGGEELAELPGGALGRGILGRSLSWKKRFAEAVVQALCSCGKPLLSRDILRLFP